VNHCDTRARTPLVLFALTTCVALFATALWSMPGTFSGDTAARARVARQLVTDGRLNVSSRGDSDHPSQFSDSDGSFPSYFGPGQSLFFIPFEALAYAAGSLGGPFRNPKGAAVVSSFSASFVSLLAVFFASYTLALTFVAAREHAVMVAVFAIFGTSYWQMIKQGQEEVQLAVFSLGLVWGFCQWASEKSRRGLIVAAVSAAAATIFRTTMAVEVGIVVMFFLLLSYRRSPTGGARAVSEVLCVFAAWQLLSGTIVGGYNRLKTGAFWNSGYSAAQGSFEGNWLSGLFGPVFGLDRGIIWSNLWLVPMIVFVIRRRESHSAGLKLSLLLTAALFLSSVLTYCRWTTWAGDFTYGARFQSHLVPLIATLLASALINTVRNASKIRLLLIAVILLQFPAIAFNANLEIYQSIASGSAFTVPGETPTSSTLQIPSRYRNFLSKSLSGTFPRDDKPPAAADFVRYAANAGRWDFLLLHARSYLGSPSATALTVIWSAALIISILLWAVVLRLAARIDTVDRQIETRRQQQFRDISIR
jgi:hypothetical protein